MVDTIDKVDWKKTIQEKKADFGLLHGRMIKDDGFFYMDDYKMKDDKGKPLEDIINVTFNDAATSLNRANAILTGAVMQTVVEGKGMKDKDTTPIEDFLRDFFLTLDERLMNQGLGALYPFTVDKMNRRGWIGTRCLVQMQGDKFLPDIAPWDMKNVVYERGVDGINYAGNITSRSKEEIEDEYPEETKNKTIREGRSEITDIWTTDKNIVLIEGNELKQQDHKLGYPPVVIGMSEGSCQPPGAEGFEHTGESIISTNRKLYNELNRDASIFQTLTVAQFLGSLQYASKEGEGSEKKPETPPFGLRKVYPTDIGGGYEHMPIADVRRAAQLFTSMLESRLQRGLFSALDLGTIMFPLSALAISRMTAHQNEILIPRISGIARFYQQLARMIIKQYIDGGITAELGEEGSRTKYEPGTLEGEYTTKYKFFASSPEQEIANLSVAGAASKYLSPDTIRRKILQLENPDEEGDKFLANVAEMNDEVLARYRWCCSLIAQERDVEAKLVKNSLITAIRQRLAVAGGTTGMPQIGGQLPGGRGEEKPPIPLLDEGQGGRPPKVGEEPPEGAFNPEGMGPETESVRRETPLLERR